MVKEITIIASLDPHKKCISIDGDGAGVIKFDTDATQLASVLSALATFKEQPIKLTLKPLKGDLENARPQKGSKTLR